MQRHPIYKQFVAWSCGGSSVGPLSDYMNNPANSVYIKEAVKLERNNSKINLHITLKEAATKKLRLRVWAYSLGEHLDISSKNGLTLRHRTYAINQTDDDLLELGEGNL